MIGVEYLSEQILVVVMEQQMLFLGGAILNRRDVELVVYKPCDFPPLG